MIEPKFQWASSFSGGLGPVNRTRNCGYVDISGADRPSAKVSAGETDCATVWGDFVDGLARWKFGKKYGFIDRTGKTRIEPRDTTSRSTSRRASRQSWWAGSGDTSTRRAR